MEALAKQQENEYNSSAVAMSYDYQLLPGKTGVVWHGMRSLKAKNIVETMKVTWNVAEKVDPCFSQGLNHAGTQRLARWSGQH